MEKEGGIDAFDEGIVPIDVVLAFQSATEATDVPLTLQVFTSTEKGPHPKWSDESKLTSNLATPIKQATNERAPIERQHLTPLHTNSQV